MHQEQMLTMDQLLQLYEGLHETVRRNELTLKLILAGMVLLLLVFSGVANLANLIINSAFGTSSMVGLSFAVMTFCVIAFVNGCFMFRRVNTETGNSKSKLKEVVVLVHEYRQTLTGLNPVFMKAVDMRLVRL